MLRSVILEPAWTEGRGSSTLTFSPDSALVPTVSVAVFMVWYDDQTVFLPSPSSSTRYFVSVAERGCFEPSWCMFFNVLFSSLRCEIFRWLRCCTFVWCHPPLLFHIRSFTIEEAFFLKMCKLVGLRAVSFLRPFFVFVCFNCFTAGAQHSRDERHVESDELFR